MTRFHQDWDYKLYKIYIWGGLPLIVIYILVTTLVFDVLERPGPYVFLVVLGPFLLWFTGVLLYWWWVFLFKGNRELAELSKVQEQKVPDIKALQSWNTLHQAMSIHGGNIEALIKNEKKARRPIILWYGSINLLAFWILCPVTMGSLKIIEMNGGVWLAGVFVWVALMLVGTPFMLRWGSKRGENAYLTPLGLAITATPRLGLDDIGFISGGQILIPDGPAIVEGERYGYLVHIETMDKDCLTVLQAQLPEFKVQSNDGKLAPEIGAPEAVVKALKSLRKAKRWRGITVYAGPKGIAIRRQSRGTNMWLYDLWLAEYLLNSISEG